MVGCDQEPETEGVDRGPEAADELSEAGQELQGGLFDTEFEAAHPGAVYLQIVGSDRRCSGTLVTPKWVLTAAHCIDEEHEGVHRSLIDWKVYVGPLSMDLPEDATEIPRTQRTFLHTRTTSGTIPYLDAPTDFFPYRDTDLALVRLDSRVDHPIGLHAKLSARRTRARWRVTSRRPGTSCTSARRRCKPRPPATG